jgi:hypothetical protein
LLGNTNYLPILLVNHYITLDSKVYKSRQAFDGLLLSFYDIYFNAIGLIQFYTMNKMIIPSNLKEKIIQDMVTITILSFIKEEEREREEVSKDRVAKYMNEKRICSRPTTLKIIDSLLQAEILLDRGRGKRNSSDLVVNKDFPYDKLMQESFTHHVKEREKQMEPFKGLIDKGIIKAKNLVE